MAEEAGMSLEERLGTGAVADAAPSKPSKVEGMSLEDRLRGGPDLTKTDIKTQIVDTLDSFASGARGLVDQVKRGFGMMKDEIYPKSAQERIVEQGKDIAGTAGMVADMAWNWPTQAVMQGIVAPLNAIGRATLHGESPQTAFKTANEYADHMMETIPWTNPAKKVLQMLNSGEVYDKSTGGKLMQDFGKLQEEADRSMVNAHGIPPGSFTTLTNQMLALLPFPKVSQIGKPAVQPRGKFEAAKETYSPEDRTDIPRLREAEQRRLDAQPGYGLQQGAGVPFDSSSPLKAAVSQLPPETPPAPAPVSGAKPRIRPKSQRGGMPSPKEMADAYSDADLKEMGMTREELVKELTDERPADLTKIVAGSILAGGGLGIVGKKLYDYFNPPEPELDEENYNPDTGNPLAKYGPAIGAMFIPVGRHSPASVLARKQTAIAMERAGKSREDIWAKTQLGKFGSDHWYEEVSDKEAKLRPNLPKNMQTGRDVIGTVTGEPLRDFLDHPELEKRTPGVMGRRTIYDPSGEYISEYRHHSVPEGREFRFTGLTDQSSVLHEIQHAISSAGGADTGISPAYFLPDNFNEMRNSAVQKYVDFIKDNPDYINAKYRIRTIGALLDKVEDPNRPRGVITTPMKLLQDLSKTPKFGQFVDIVREIRKVDDMDAKAFEQYRTTTGEAMARLTQKRRNMTAEERAARPPWEDLDVPSKDLHKIPDIGPGEAQLQKGDPRIPDEYSHLPIISYKEGVNKYGLPNAVPFKGSENIFGKDVLRLFVDDSQNGKPVAISLPESIGKQSGFASPELMNLMAGGSLGALAGMSLADPEDRFMGAGIGAALGLGLASRAGKNIGRQSRFFRSAEESLQGVVEDFFRRVNPDALGPHAEGASAILAKHYVDMMRRHIKEGVGGEERQAFFSKLSEAEHKQFIRGLEMGVKFKDPNWQKYATEYRQMALDIAQRDMKLGIKYDPLDHYIFHIFESPGAAQAYLQNKYGKGWDQNINQKAARYLLDLENAGFKLRMTNPEEIMRARQYSSDIAKLKVDSLEELSHLGIAREKTRGSFIQPGETEWTSPNGKQYYLPDHANQVFHNAFDTKSLWDDTGAVGMSYRGLMWAKNALVPWKLLSLFHPLHVELGMNSGTNAVNAIKSWAAGNMSAGEAAGTTLGKMILPVDALARLRYGLRGMQPEAMKAWRGELDPAKMTPEINRQITMALEGGFNPEMAAEYKNQHIKAFKDAIGRVKDSYGTNLFADAQALWQLPFAALEGIWTRPVFENWIPAMKWEAYQKSSLAHMAANPDLASKPLDRMVALRKISKMIDDRFGEMQYKTLFMDRMVKDIAVASFLSYGWQYGFMRSYVGAFPEAARAFTQNEPLAGRGTLRERIAKGELDKTLFLGNYLMATMFYGGLMTWALSGDTPKDIMDYIYPRNGDKNPDGSDARVSTPFYTREFVSIPKHMQEEGALKGLGITVANKLTPALGLISGLVTNKDFFNREISDPNADLTKRTLQKLAYVAGELEPISSSAPRRSGKAEFKDYALAAAGFAPAPKYVTEGPAEALIHQYLKYHRPAVTPYEKAQRGQEVYQLFRLKQGGDVQAFETELDRVRSKYKLTDKEVDRIRKEADVPVVFKQFKILSPDEQQRVLDKLPAEERGKFKPYARRAIREKMERE